MSLKFCSLSSGSSGNCYYIGSTDGGILIDAGISAKNIRKFLDEKGISINTIMGVLVTHNHTDHIKGIEVLSRKYSIPVYTSIRVWESIIKPGSKISRDYFREIFLQKIFNVAGIDIEAFPVSHDAPETIGFYINSGGKKITVATDLGYISEQAAAYIREANLLVIESNYDENMLLAGHYPPFLKKRIMSDKGHLGYHQTSAFLADNINGNLEHICLAHLSKQNNTPELALQSISEALQINHGQAITGVGLTVLRRNLPSEIIGLDN
jgi:phosphoribosyl 1,2-cyclic phosphodiesterase